jgi:hypothetical protein
MVWFIFLIETLLLGRSVVVRRLGHCVRKMFWSLSKQFQKETGVRKCYRVLGGKVHVFDSE